MIVEVSLLGMEKDKPKKMIKMTDIVPPSKKEEEFVTRIEVPTSVPTDVGTEVGEKKEEEIEIEEKIEKEEVIQPEILEEAPVEEERIFTEDLFTSKSKKKKKIFVLTGVICLIILGIIFCSTLSKAEIVIKPKTEKIQFQTELNVNKNVAFIELDNNRIPGQFFQVEKEEQREFPATQEKELKEKAKGIITVYNQYSSAPQTIVKTTRFVSEKELVFRTTKTIVIPGAKVEGGQIIASSIDIEVEAAEPGDKYNIGPVSFTIPGFKGTSKYIGFYGKSTQPMTGGVVGKVKVVSEEDIQGATDVLAVELKGKAKKELEKKIPSDLKILEDTILEEIIESSSNIEANQPAERFTLKVKVAAKVLGFNENDAISLINDNLKSKISEDKSLVPDTIEFSYTIADINLEKGTAKLACDVEENVAWNINLEEIKRALAGKNEIEVRQYFASRVEIESVKVIFWPFWVKNIPSKEDKIKITLD